MGAVVAKIGGQCCYSGLDKKLQQQRTVIGTPPSVQEHMDRNFELAPAPARVHLLICTLDYKYDPENSLNAAIDGDNWCSLARACGIEDVVYLTDKVVNPDGTPIADIYCPLCNRTGVYFGSRCSFCDGTGTSTYKNRFPNKENIKREIMNMGRRTQAGDSFVFFFAGHGENVPDQYPFDEDDGMDEAYVTATLKGDEECPEIEERNYLVDDDFCRVLEEYIHPACSIMVISDCCHSASICDVDSYEWNDHKIIAFSACKDSETDADLEGQGGCLTMSMRQAMSELFRERRLQPFSVKSLFCKLDKYAKRINDDQNVTIQWANVDIGLFQWPFMVDFPAHATHRGI